MERIEQMEQMELEALLRVKTERQDEIEGEMFIISLLGYAYGGLFWFTLILVAIFYCKLGRENDGNKVIELLKEKKKQIE